MLDLGGGGGALNRPVSQRGYEYFNIDVDPRGAGRRVSGDAHKLPFRDRCFDYVVSSDTLEHFYDPLHAIVEVRRVLKPDGRFVIWVPFLQAFHENDYYRYTPLGIEWLMNQAGFRILAFEAPLWIFSVFAQALLVLLQRIGLGFFEGILEAAAEKMDRIFVRLRSDSASFAAYYLIVVEPEPALALLDEST